LGGYSAGNYDSVFIKEYNASGTNDTGLVGECTLTKALEQLPRILQDTEILGHCTTARRFAAGKSTFNSSCPQWQATDGGQWNSRSDVKLQQAAHFSYDGVNDMLMREMDEFEYTNAINGGGVG